MRRLARRDVKILPVLATLVCTGCGILSVGGTAPFNDPVPDGPVISQGRLESSNVTAHPDKKVSGDVKIYQDTTLGFDVIRIESFSAPSEGGLLIIAVAGGTQVLNTGLRGISGNQNYVTSVPVTDSRTWSSVTIRSSSWPDPATRDYGQALLSSP